MRHRRSCAPSPAPADADNASTPLGAILAAMRAAQAAAEAIAAARLTGRAQVMDQQLRTVRLIPSQIRAFLQSAPLGAFSAGLAPGSD